MKFFETNDKVSFAGDLDVDALAETNVAYADEAKHQVIIEHPNGHMAAEFNGTPGLDANKKYASVAAKNLKVVGRAVTIETVLEETTTDTGETKVNPLSDVLSFLKSSRPDSEGAMIDKMIADAQKQESKVLLKAKEDTTKIIAESNEVRQTEAAAETLVATEKLNEETRIYLEEQQAELKRILTMVTYLGSKGILLYDETKRLFVFKGEVMQLFVGNGIEPSVAISTYFYNTPSEYEILRKEVLAQNTNDKAGAGAANEAVEIAIKGEGEKGAGAGEVKKENTEVTASQVANASKTPADSIDFKAKTEAANREIIAKREAEAAAGAGAGAGAGESKEEAAYTEPVEAEFAIGGPISGSNAEINTPAKGKTKTAKVKTPKAEKTPAVKTPVGSADDLFDYAANLLALDGIGAKVVEKIIAVYPTKEALAAGVASKDLPFTDKVNETLKKASKKKAFKVA